MSSAPGTLVNLAAAPAGLPAAPGSVWRAPLVPVALVFTAGVSFSANPMRRAIRDTSPRRGDALIFA